MVQSNEVIFVFDDAIRGTVAKSGVDFIINGNGGEEVEGGDVCLCEVIWVVCLLLL